MKKIISSILFLFLLSLVTYSQENKVLKNFNSMKEIAIKEVADFYYNNLNDDEKNNTFYAVNQCSERIDISNIKTKLSIKSINLKDKKNKQLLREGIRVFLIKPILDEDKILIRIINYKVYYKKRMYHYINSGGSDVFFQFSYKEKGWVLIEISHTGI